MAPHSQTTQPPWLTAGALLLTAFAALTPGAAHAQDPTPTEESSPAPEPDAEPDDSLTLSAGDIQLSIADRTSEVEPSSFEFSLSSAQLFPSTEIFQYGDETDLVPTGAVLLLIEYFLSYRWRLRFMYNLRTSTEKTIRTDTGEVNESVSPSTVGLGLSWVPLSIRFRETSRVEFQGSLLLSTVLDDERLVFPTATGRIHLMQDAEAGVGVYLGVLYEFRRNTIGPYYGVGYRF